MPVDPEALSKAVGEVVEAATDSELGDLATIRDLPGVPKTIALTLRRAWGAGLDLAAAAPGHPRLAALARIEGAVLERLPAGQLRPGDLVQRAVARLAHAPAVLGDVEFRGLPDLDRCWRPLVRALSETVRVAWDAGAFAPPAWLDGSGIQARRATPTSPAIRTVSCATARHEVLEALRWARELLATGRARPQDIAFAAASTAPFDDFVFSLGREANLPIHFAHGRNALHTAEGQAAAALADVLLRGLSQERVRRLEARAHAPGSELAKLPDGWWTKLPAGAPLTTAERWRQALSDEDARAVADVLLPVVELLERGPGAAAEAGERLLRGAARALWRRALVQAPGSALDRELATLRVKEAEDPDPAAAIAWTPASSLASCPRPFVWLLGLNAQSWPRPPSEDPLLPRRVLGGFVLEEVSVSEADRRSFATISASAAAEVVRSFSRREVGGRRLGVSPLVAGAPEEILHRTRIPAHAMSEPDRLMARPDEFALTAMARAAKGCWDAWRDPEITRHDGLVRAEHPAIVRALRKVQSASSLTLLVRNPIGFLWVHALGMSAPEMDDEPLSMDPRSFGTLVHAILDAAVRDLEAGGGIAAADRARVEATVTAQAAKVGARWATEHPVPPDMLWGATLKRAETLVLNGLLFPLPALPGQRSYSEVPFGTGRADGDDRPLPWDPAEPVPVPGTGLSIRGYIDRVDVSGDGSAARVVDYKTGSRAGDFVLRGGRELQRCLYAYAVQALLGGEPAIEAALLYPARTSGAATDGEYDPLPAPRETLDLLTEGLDAAVRNLRQGFALPGVAAGARYKDCEKKGDNAYHEQDELSFALPVVPGTMLGPKKAAARGLLDPKLVAFWDAR